MRSWLLSLLVAAATTSLIRAAVPAEIEEGIMRSGRIIRQINFPGSAGHSPGHPQGQGGIFPSPGDGVPPVQGGHPPVQGGGQGGAPIPSGECVCAPIVSCAAELDLITTPCKLENGVDAVCCPVRALASFAPAKGTGDEKMFKPAAVDVRVNVLDPSGIDAACQSAINRIEEIQTTERNLVSNNIILNPGSPAYGHLRVFRVSPKVSRQGRDAFAIALASQNIMNDFSLTRNQGAFGLQTLSVSDSLLADRCPPAVQCSNLNSKYRTADGSCNNKGVFHWGQSATPVQRILPPTYQDGIFEPRSLGANGNPLPSVREIANRVLVDVDNPDQAFTSSVMQWAQFLDHDTTHSPFPSLESGEGIECCPEGNIAPSEFLHPKCLPIDVTGDAFFGPRGQKCMNFIRSILAVEPGPNCTFGFAEQVNALTHWLDGSMVYGSNEEEQMALRARQNGLLATSGNNLPPINPEQGGECSAGDRGALCYLGGDSRINEQPGLTAIHTIWIREHNRIARELQRYNPQWSDEAIFQEARRIVVAELQHITFNEWLPIIVGPTFVQAFGLNTRTSGFSNDYNPSINPNINNEFSTAAFRFGHTLVQGNLRLFSASGQVSTIQLRDHFNSPHLIQSTPGVLDMIVRSWTKLAIQKFDSFITQELSNHLFQTPAFNFGMDLMSLNMHRGREHGIATYNSVRRICGLPEAKSFNDLKDQIPAQIVDRLSRIYESVDDIDMFVGGITERPVAGGLLGHTFLCVVGDQFARLKKGDRYFYDLGGQAGSFTEPQLQEIRRISWARVICDNADNLQRVQPLAFRQTNSRFNQPVPCNSPQIPRPNLLAWRGERPEA